MAIRPDDSIPITIPNIEQFRNRIDIRAYLLRLFIDEPPNAKFRYFVETFDSSKRIYFERPGRLNKGCDFVIYAEDQYLWNNGNDRPPDHSFVLNDLRIKKEEMTYQQWSRFLNSINAIYNCDNYENTSRFINGLPQISHSYELVLKLIRWFFIEQDITYWAGQGRAMFKDAISNI